MKPGWKFTLVIFKAGCTGVHIVGDSLSAGRPNGDAIVKYDHGDVVRRSCTLFSRTWFAAQRGYGLVREPPASIYALYLGASARNL